MMGEGRYYTVAKNTQKHSKSCSCRVVIQYGCPEIAKVSLGCILKIALLYR